MRIWFETDCIIGLCLSPRDALPRSKRKTFKLRLGGTVPAWSPTTSRHSSTS